MEAEPGGLGEAGGITSGINRVTWVYAGMPLIYGGPSNTSGRGRLVDQVSHSQTRPSIKVKLTGTATLELTRIAWEISEKLWREYGIDLLVEDEPVYLVNPTMGVNTGDGLIELSVETSKGLERTYTLPVDLGDTYEIAEKLEDLVLRTLLHGEPVVSASFEDPFDTNRPSYLEVALI